MITLTIVGVLIGVVWISCGVLSCGYLYNFYQSEWTSIAEKYEQEDYIRALHEIVWGPIGLLVRLEMHHTKYGLRFRRYKYINGIRQV